MTTTKTDLRGGREDKERERMSKCYKIKSDMWDSRRGTCCKRDIRAAPVMVMIATVGRPDLVFDDDEGGHCSAERLFLVT